jgi:hypothetical protein
MVVIGRREDRGHAGFLLRSPDDTNLRLRFRLEAQRGAERCRNPRHHLTGTGIINVAMQHRARQVTPLQENSTSVAPGQIMQKARIAAAAPISGANRSIEVWTAR